MSYAHTFSRPRWLVASGLFLLGMLVAGCQPAPQTPPDPSPAADTPAPTEPIPPTPEASPTPTPPPEPVVVRLALDAMPQTLDPARVAPLDASGTDLAHNLFVPLAQLDAVTGEVQPALAASWERLEDGRVWNVYLRDDVPWVQVDPASGEVVAVRAVTAADVVAAAHHACRADSGTPVGTHPALFLLQGCREVYQTDPALLTDDDVSRLIGVRVLNDVAVEFRLTHDSAVFATLLTSLPLAPAPPEQVDGPDGLLTSGPFALAGWRDDGYRLIANPFWPVARSGNVSVVEASMSDGTLRGWQNGEADVAAVPEGALPALPVGDPAYRVLAQPVVTFVAAAQEVPPLDNPDLRRALSLALDRAALAPDALPAASFVPPGVAPGLEPLPAPAADPDAARAALAQAGYDGCRGLAPITVLAVDTPQSVALAERVTQMWAQTLGCDGVFTVEARPAFEVITALQGPAQGRGVRAGLIVARWQGDTPDAHHYLTDVLACREAFPGAFLDLARPCLPDEESLADAGVERDPAERAALYDRVNAAFFGANGDYPVIPLTVQARVLAVNPWVEVEDAPAGPLRFDTWAVNAAEQPDAAAR